MGARRKKATRRLKCKHDWQTALTKRGSCEKCKKCKKTRSHSDWEAATVEDAVGHLKPLDRPAPTNADVTCVDCGYKWFSHHTVPNPVRCSACQALHDKKALEAK